MTLRAVIDLETLDTSPTAVILQIGVCKFTDEKIIGEPQSICLDTDEQLLLGRTVGTATREFWARQPKDIWDSVRNGSVDIVSAMDWLRSELDTVDEVWATAPTLDHGCVDCLCAQMSVEMPWKYYKVRDVRTLRSLFPRETEWPRSDLHHTAENDAKAAAEQVMFALRYIRIDDHLHTNKDKK